MIPPPSRDMWIMWIGIMFATYQSYIVTFFSFFFFLLYTIHLREIQARIGATLSVAVKKFFWGYFIRNPIH